MNTDKKLRRLESMTGKTAGHKLTDMPGAINESAPAKTRSSIWIELHALTCCTST